MAKNKPKGGVMGRRDVPLAERLQRQRAAVIAAERQDSAETIIKLACVVMNEMFGIGFTRLTKFAVRLMEMTQWYYNEDPDVALAQLNGRLEQIGFDMRKGKVSVYQDTDGRYLKLDEARKEGFKVDDQP